MFASPGAIAFQIPAIFGFGPFPVRWYGILMATSIVVGLWVAHRQAKREGLPADVAWKLYISPAHRPPGFGQFEYFHPTFLYESIWDFAVFVALVSWLRPSLRQYPGALFFCYIGLYSIGRFAIEALRLDSFWLGNFRVPQLASVLGVLVAVIGLAWTRHRSSPVPACGSCARAWRRPRWRRG